jgi:glycosyltransferase involved in cell wall biosynthesis
MKVVILHDWLTGFRGGERVLEALCEMYPDAPIYTLIHKKGSTSPLIESKEIITSFLNKIPGIHENYRFFLPLMPLAVDMLKITHEADLIISSSHCVIKGVKKPESSKHICYIHSPMRYIYDQFDNYFGKTKLPIRLAAKLVRPYLQWWDKKSNANVDLIIPNSRFVQDRVQKYYHEDCYVINPFVDLKDFKKLEDTTQKKEDYYLMVTAFAPNKRVDLAIQAFNELGHNLRIIGSGARGISEHFTSIANNNIEFLGNCSRDEVIANMAKAKAFIFPGVEDFGITPLEVLASGTPIVAFAKGGALETLNTDVATFFTAPTISSLVEAVQLNEKKSYDISKLRNRANDFSKERFVSSFTHKITSLMKQAS